MLRRTLLGLLALVCAGWFGPVSQAQDAPADLKPSTAAVRKAVLAVIEGQLAAFREQKPEAAYDFAAPALRTALPLPRFLSVVKSGYPEIWTNQQASFGVVRDSGERATVAVKVQGAEGSASYDYILLKVAVGWRIGGVLRHVLQADQAL